MHLPLVCAPTPQQATTKPHLCQIHGHTQTRLLWGHCSFLLGPGTQDSVCALQESFSQSYVSSVSSMVGLKVTSSKIMPYTHPEPLSLQQTIADLYVHRRCSNTVLSQSLRSPWVLVYTRFV